MSRKIHLYATAILLSAAFVFSGPEAAFCEMMQSEKPVARKGGPREQKPEKIEARMQELDAKLDLTLEQKVKIKEILTGVKQDIYKLVNEAAAKAKKIREKGEADIESILTKEQQNIFNNVPKEEEQEEDEMLKVFK